MKKKLLICLACLLAVAGCFCGIYYYDSEVNDVIKKAQNIVQEEIENLKENEIEEVIVNNYIKSEAVDTIQATQEGEDVSTQEVIESNLEEENLLEDELEVDGTVEQENISYDGTNTGNGLSLLGAYQGLTYYNQRRYTLGKCNV